MACFIRFLSVVAAATENNDDSEDDDPGAVIVEKMAKAVANGINKALQPKLSLKDIEGLIG